MTDLAIPADLAPAPTTQPNAMLLSSGLTRDQVELLKKTICKDATDDELDLFVAVCNHRRLNPFTGQIHFVKRRVWNAKLNGGEGGFEEVGSHQTGIDGYRLIAERTGLYGGPVGTWWCGPDGNWRDVWLEDYPPAAAKVAIQRKDFAQPSEAIARWKAYVQTRKGGGPNAMWSRMDAEQLAKCYSEDTEVLTDHGFQRFSEVTGRILQVTPDGLWPTDAKPFVQPYQGPMITLDSDDLNFSVTPNHDMVTTHGKIEASALYDEAQSRPRHWIPRSITGEGVDFPIKDEAIQLAAAYIADGSDGTAGRFRIEVSRPRKVARLRALGLHLDEQQRKTAGAVAHTATRDIVTRSDKARFVYDLGQVAPLVAGGKDIDVGAVLVLSRRQARVFVDALVYFDGSVTPSGVRRWRSVRPDHVAAFEIAAVRAGYAVNVPRRRRSDISTRTTFELTISDRSDIPVIRWGREHSRSKSNAAGRTGLRMTYTYEPVWCVTVPSGEIVVRRNGFSMRCGNCAEALVLRKVFPEELSGIYTTDEMAQASNPNTTVRGDLDGVAVEVDTATGEVRPLAEQIQTHELWADDMPTAWAIENVRDVEDAKWLLQQPEVGDDYREAVKAVIAAAGLHWPAFWRTGNTTEWRNALRQAFEQSGSDQGPPPAPSDPDQKSRGVPVVEGSASAGGEATPRGTNRPSTPTPAPEVPAEADRAGVEGGDANHDRPERDAPGDAASSPPGPSPLGPGGTTSPVGGTTTPKGVRGRHPKGREAAGRATSKIVDQARFEAGLAERAPEGWTR